jgi:hypothetical protein
MTTWECEVMGFGLSAGLLCLAGAILLVAPFAQRKRFREMILRPPGIVAWIAEKRPELTEQVVSLFTAAWVFGVVVIITVCLISIWP